MAEAPGVIEFRMHSGARWAYYIGGGLLLVAVLTAPVGLWFFWGARRVRVVIDDSEIRVYALTTTVIRFAEVKRLGICRVPIYASGLGGTLARQKVGGNTSVNLCVFTERGKTRQFVASMFERYEVLLAQVKRIVGLPYEEVTMGTLALQWPATDPA